MGDHIPFLTGGGGGNLIKEVYADSQVVRVPLDRAATLRSSLPETCKVWVDPSIDGMHDIESRRVIRRKDRNGKVHISTNTWFSFMSSCTTFEKVAANLSKPVPGDVTSLVNEILDRCAELQPAWVTVPQVPLVDNSQRNKVNRLMAAAAGKWKSKSGFSGQLIFPLVITSQGQIRGKTPRGPKVREAERCYRLSQAEGLWVVDSSLNEEDGSADLRNRRFRYLINLHEELNERVPSKIKIAGPYWGLNLVLWAKGLVDHPAIGIGSGYQYLMAGGPITSPTARLALPSLRRRVGIGDQLKKWLDTVVEKLAPSHPAHQEFSDIRKHYQMLTLPGPARKQVATFYKRWFNTIAAVPKPGRTMALFQDLSAAYALGKSLTACSVPDLDDEEAARSPESVAQALMLSCL